MKYILLFLLGLIPFLGMSQAIERFGARLIITDAQLIGGSDDFYIDGTLRHPRATYVGDSVQVNDIIVDADCNVFTVDSILSVISNFITVRVTPADTTVNTVREATGGILRAHAPPEGNNGAYTFPANMPIEILDCYMNYFSQTVGVNNVYITDDTLYVIDGFDTFAVELNSIDLTFDGNRNILRVPEAGDNLGTTTVTEWLEWWYFTAPTITLGSLSSPKEVGTVTQYILSGATTNAGGAILSNGMLRVTSPSTDTLLAFGTATSYADTITFEPQQDSTGQFKSFSFTFAAKQNWVFGSESGTATSSSRTITAVYPVLYGMSSTDFTSSGDPYTTITKIVEAEGNKSVSFTGSGFIYYLVPKTWGDYTLSIILDHNGFNVTPSFTAYDIDISSTGLTNDWTTVAYKMYKLDTTTITSNYEYTFTR